MLDASNVFNVFYYIFICIIFYLLGSIPFAYLFLKLHSNKDITKEGSGNVGTMNAYEVSNSKLNGFLVLIFDLLKGTIPVWWFLNFSGFNPYFLIIPAFLIILGHNYSVWLKFKGGRGLATAAGIFIIVNFTLVGIWIIVFFVMFLIKRNIHIANVVATIFLPLVIIFTQDLILNFNNPHLENLSHQFEFLFALSSSICLIILIRHIEPIRELIKKNK
jgi:acyl phosphate:glycerol-3-phosphate acyltransferase